MKKLKNVGAQYKIRHDVKSQGDSLRAEVVSLREELSQFKTKGKLNKQNNLLIMPEIDSLSEIFSEIQDRVDRFKNVILYNVPESKSSDVKMRTEHDRGFILQLLAEAEVNSPNIKVFRFGKYFTLLMDEPFTEAGLHNPRALKVILYDNVIASQILKKRSILSDKTVKITADLTLLQRKLLKQAYDELATSSINEQNLQVRFIRVYQRLYKKNLESISTM